MSTLESRLKRAFGTSLVLSITLIIFGVHAITLSIASSIGIAIVIGWLALFAGIAQVVQNQRVVRLVGDSDVLHF